MNSGESCQWWVRKALWSEVGHCVASKTEDDLSGEELFDQVSFS